MVFGLTNSPDERLKLHIAGEGQDGAADWSDGRRECKPHPLLIPLPHTEAVLEDCVEDTTDTEGGLNHRGSHVNNWGCIIIEQT